MWGGGGVCVCVGGGGGLWVMISGRRHCGFFRNLILKFIEFCLLKMCIPPRVVIRGGWRF